MVCCDNIKGNFFMDSSHAVNVDSSSDNKLRSPMDFTPGQQRWFEFMCKKGKDADRSCLPPATKAYLAYTQRAEIGLAPTFTLIDYKDKDNAEAIGICPDPSKTYAYIQIFNPTSGQVELRCAPNINGAHFHKNLSGYAEAVISAGEVKFDSVGFVEWWNLRSSIYP